MWNNSFYLLHKIDAIFSIDSCREALIFKGGTCLRKCYIPDYRFSEDLDFTSINPDFQLDEDLLWQIMSLVLVWSCYWYLLSLLRNAGDWLRPTEPALTPAAIP
ncbi:nucleotidyl transferase AbiEii/AbiGii toxin family protein [Olivibacter sp. XZL3]|uniref:nucleotidyl transferase AbiEii/AbiGii toxin family protein n=1 Tax=Olivibacter sp. XZL3 TaxID=1735116 RepID=UPI001066E5F4